MKHTVNDVVDIKESPILTHGTRPAFDMEALPGETVLKYLHRETAVHHSSDYMFEFCIKKIVPERDTVPTDNNGTTYYSGATPYRQAVFMGASVEEVIASMLFGFASLARNGSINPSQPAEPGDPPIQHAMSILTDRLAWQIERRHGNIHDAEPADVVTHGEVTPDTVRCGEIIAALGTAIAALARVRDL
jgi:hypothetical protein